MHVHFVGVSGTGMGALAMLYREQGHRVTGSDVAFDPPMGPALRELGVECMVGYDAAQLAGAELVIVGNAIRRDNVEAARARDASMNAVSMSGALRTTFLAGRRALVVTGTHGKTTTSAMCAWILHEAKLEPGYFIGGLPKNLPSGAAAGSSKRRLAAGAAPAPFVVEGDEYDAVYWEKRPKFFDYVGGGGPEGRDVVILTSIEHDHIDIYPDAAGYEAQFAELVAKLSPQSFLVADARDPLVRRVAAKAPCEVAYYALEGDDTGDVTPTWLGAPAGDATASGEDTLRKPSFDVFASGTSCGRFTLDIPGRHNVRNALAAVAASVSGFAVPLEDARRAMLSFRGVRRRQDLVTQARGVFVYDDFAHHPTAVRETLHALRERHARGRLFVAFEPRSATAVRSLHQVEYERAFDAADRVFLAPLGRAHVPENERLDLARLARGIGERATLATHAEILEALAREAKPNDIVAFFSNGAFGSIVATFAASLAAGDHS